MKRSCEFCGRVQETASTTFNGAYCISCYEVLIEQSTKAIKVIRARLIKQETKNGNTKTS